MYPGALPVTGQFVSFQRVDGCPADLAPDAGVVDPNFKSGLKRRLLTQLTILRLQGQQVRSKDVQEVAQELLEAGFGNTQMKVFFKPLPQALKEEDLRPFQITITEYKQNVLLPFQGKSFILNIDLVEALHPKGGSFVSLLGQPGRRLALGHCLSTPPPVLQDVPVLPVPQPFSAQAGSALQLNLHLTINRLSMEPVCTTQAVVKQWSFWECLHCKTG